MVVIPAHISDDNVDQQVKLTIEIADSNFWDGQLHLSHLRKYHSGAVVSRLLESAIGELRNPSIELNIGHDRASLVPFFSEQLARHSSLPDPAFGYPADRSLLPI